MPDVISVEVFGYLGDVEVSADSVELIQKSEGWYVEAQGASVDRVEVSMTCALADELVPAAKKAVRLIVAKEFLDREGIDIDAGHSRALERAIGQLRWWPA